jgi:hypothetical protein
MKGGRRMTTIAVAAFIAGMFLFFGKECGEAIENKFFKK